MNMDKDHVVLSWVSLILRIAMASMFAVASLMKFTMGLENAAAYIVDMFKDTFLPVGLVSIYAHVIPFVEAAITLWLLIGVRLREAWIFTAFVMISLAFGMVVTKQFGTASSNYFYVAMACMGIYLSRYDHCALGSSCCKKK